MATSETNGKLKSVFLLLATILFISTSSVYAFGLLASQNTVNTSGIVVGLEFRIYADSACTQNLTSIDWGLCYPGEDRISTVYLKNVGTVDATLTIETINWNPTQASSYFTLTSNYAGGTIAPDEVFPITFTLHVAPTITQIDSFSFTISIISEG